MRDRRRADEAGPPLGLRSRWTRARALAARARRSATICHGRGGRALPSAERQAARDRKDFKRSDELRDELERTIASASRDTKDGQRWSRAAAKEHDHGERRAARRPRGEPQGPTDHRHRDGRGAERPRPATVRTRWRLGGRRSAPSGSRGRGGTAGGGRFGAPPRRTAAAQSTRRTRRRASSRPTSAVSSRAAGRAVRGAARLGCRCASASGAPRGGAFRPRRRWAPAAVPSRRFRGPSAGRPPMSGHAPDPPGTGAQYTEQLRRATAGPRSQAAPSHEAGEPIAGPHAVSRRSARARDQAALHLQRARDADRPGERADHRGADAPHLRPLRRADRDLAHLTDRVIRAVVASPRASRAWSSTSSPDSTRSTSPPGARDRLLRIRRTSACSFAPAEGTGVDGVIIPKHARQWASRRLWRRLRRPRATR